MNFKEEQRCKRCGRPMSGDFIELKNHLNSCGKYEANKNADRLSDNFLYFQAQLDKKVTQNKTSRMIEDLSQGVRHDQWRRRLSGQKPKDDISAKHTDSVVLKNAPAVKQKIKANNVTSVCDAIYSLYTKKPISVQLEAGKKAEPLMQSHKLNYRPGKHFYNSDITDWELEYYSKKPGVASLSISRISFKGKHLLAQPDIVFSHRTEPRVLIVERKLTSAYVPCLGWPNLRAQLWAYSQCDQFEGRQVTCVGEVWTSEKLNNRLSYPETISYLPEDLDVQSQIFLALGLQVAPELCQRYVLSQPQTQSWRATK